MRQAITVTRHKNLCSSSSYTQKQRRGALSLNLQRILTSPTLRFATHYSGWLRVVFLLLKILSLLQFPLQTRDLEPKLFCLALLIPIPLAGNKEEEHHLHTAALFSLTQSAKSQDQQNSASRASGAWPAACYTKIAGVWGIQKVNTSPERCFLTITCLEEM